MVNVVWVDRPRRIDFRSKSGTWQHAFLRFHGSFVLEPLGATTRVTHREEFSFRAPLGWVVEPMLRRWLAAAMNDEMTRLKDLLESDSR
jgi:Polyketide cyclase / dehydrase and lipid transport